MTKTKHDEIVEQLDQFYNQAKRQILQNQSAITGLFPANSAENSNASIKTSLWAASSIFALYLAYSKRVDNDQGKAHDLGQSVVKCMRGILFAWMRQSDKVESFKANQSPKHALHLKFDLHSGLANDFEYPHLQIDVVSLYLIFLANFIASGLDIIYCMDEVTFIQNLVYYVERAYRTPDYGNWEPSQAAESNGQSSQQSSTISSAMGPSTTTNNNGNHPEPINYHKPNLQCINCVHEIQPLEIHATSIGMAKAALEAINGCNLFGGKGANWSIIYSDIDAHSRNRSIFETLLPRESRSKNTDSYLLATISWPCFATNDPALYNSTKSKILRKLRGKYGLKRFLRDPYGTTLDPEALGMAAAAAASIVGTPTVGNNASQGNVSFSESLTSNRSTSTPLQQQQQQQQGYPLIATPSTPTTTATATTSAPANIREISFSSTTSGSSQISSLNVVGGAADGDGVEPSKKQRKSSYYQRKNVFKPQSNPAGDANNASATGVQLLRPSENNSSSKMSKRFEHIECEWPLFVCFLIIDGIFKQDMEQIYENEKLLYERLLKIETKHGDYLMPKYYYVPQELINSEKCHPDSVERLASQEGSCADQLYLTGQSILLITRLLLAGLVHPNELDPLRRHMPSHDRPKRIGRYSSFQATSSDLVVQTVLIAESIRLQAMMANYGIQTQTPLEVEPVQIWSSAELVKAYEYLGVNEKLGLKGRPSRPIGALGTSKLYRICGQTILCYPLIFEVSDFYLAQDMLLLIDDIQNELNFIGRYWRMSGRPTVCILIREEHLRDVHFRDLLDLLVQFKNGQLKKSGLRIKTGRLQNLISSSCIEHLDFLHLLPHEHLPAFKPFRQLSESPHMHVQPQTSNTGSTNTTNHDDSNQNTNYLCVGGGGGAALASLNTGAPMVSRPAKSIKFCSASSNDLPKIEEQSLAREAREAKDLEDFAKQLDFNMSDASMYRYTSNSELDHDHNYSTEPKHSIDYYECYKEAPTWPTLIELLRTCRELSGQSQLLAILWEREGAKYTVDDMSVEDRLERVSQLACHSRNWSVVRYCSVVLKRSVESLSPWLTSILVNGKQISLGLAANEKIINNPLTPTEIHTLIYSTISTKNPCDAVLQQEIALYIGRLISTRPDYFQGILTIRVSNFMSAMRSYLNIKTNERKLKLEQLHRQRQEKATNKMRLQQESTQDPQQQTTTIDKVVVSEQVNNENQELQPQQQQQLLDLRIKPEHKLSTSSARSSQILDVEFGKHSTSLMSQGHSYPSADGSQPPQQQQSSSLGIPQIKVEQHPTPSTSHHYHQHQHQHLHQHHHYHLHHHYQQTKPHNRAHKRLPQNLVARPLESLSPSDVRKLLVKVLMDDDSLSLSDKRQITGELCRVPKDFYDKVWSLLGCTNIGIVIGGRMLRSIPVLTSMTQDDLNFALKVESLLSAIDCPKLRQINVELLMALHVILERNPEIRFDSDPIDLEKIIKLSLDKFRTDHDSSEIGLREFYCSSTQTVMLYAVRTVFDCLLPLRYKEQLNVGGQVMVDDN